MALQLILSGEAVTAAILTSNYRAKKPRSISAVLVGIMASEIDPSSEGGVAVLLDAYISASFEEIGFLS